jgi:hypothetical protein
MNNIKRGTKRDGMDMMDRISAYRELIQIMQQLRYIFDGQTAKEALEAHLA